MPISQAFSPTHGNPVTQDGEATVVLKKSSLFLRAALAVTRPFVGTGIWFAIAAWDLCKFGGAKVMRKDPGTTLHDLLQHRFNPVHYFCRLLDSNVPSRTARRISRVYERVAYRPAVVGGPIVADAAVWTVQTIGYCGPHF